MAHLRKYRISATIGVFAVVAALLIGATPATAATSYPSDSTAPDPVSLLSGMNSLWASDGSNDLKGTVKNAGVLEHNDEIAVWINNHATAAQRFRALQDANDDGSKLASTALGSSLGSIYLKGRDDGSLPLTSALMSSIGSYVSPNTAKTTYSYPRPYLPTSASTDDDACDASVTNASSLAGIRSGKSYADSDGNLAITRVADATDTTGTYTSSPTTLSAGYGSFCSSGSFPSGHTTGAYLQDLTLATLLPELAPEILARASEAANDRIVLGVHYPLDIIGGRINGEAGVAERWSDAEYRKDVLEPARAELVKYLEAQCGSSLATCIANQTAYHDDPYDGSSVPGGSSQIVTDRASAVSTYRERLTYGFSQVGEAGQAASVPDAAVNLLDTTFPTLTDTQRKSVLAQTEIDSGYPLDASDSDGGSWQRLDLAAAMSATVRLNTDGSVTVLSTGGTAHVVSSGTGAVLTAPDGATVAAGDDLQVVGAGYTAGSTYTLRIDNASTGSATATAGDDGSFTTSVSAPATLSSGAHTLSALSPSGAVVATMSFTVKGSAYADSVTTTSPDGGTVATVYTDTSGSLGYTVTQNGRTVVKPSSLGLTVGGTDWGNGVALGTASASSENTKYAVLGTHDSATDHYNAHTIPVEKNGTSALSVEIRVFDTGIALRYDLGTSEAGKTVTGEATSFTFPSDSDITYQGASQVNDMQADTSQSTLADLGTTKITTLPTLKLPSGSTYANIAEANVRDWPAMALQTSSSGAISSYYWATDNGKGTFDVAQNTLHSPFRVVTIASNLTDLTNSDIITNVNDPVDTAAFANGDTSWIGTGTAAWASLDSSIGQDQTVSVVRRLIDDASDAQEPYVLVEGALADSSWGSTTAERFANLRALVKQGLAEKHPVRIWLWMNYNDAAGVDSSFTDTVDYSSGSAYAKNSLQNPDLLDAYLDLVQDTGIVGVKIDHIGDDTETKVNLYGDVDKAAAERKLMVEFHNPLEPTGLNRTYPNEIGREAIRGVEINYDATQDTLLPFTRYVAGTADYTPLLFSNSSKQGTATWAHEAASTVMFTNPYLQISENPAYVASGGVYHALLGDIVKNVPTTWKKSWFLDSSDPGSVASVVRESNDGEYWVAVLGAAGASRDVSVPLDFLPSGTKYNADIYSDKQSPSSMSRTTRSVSHGTTLTAHLASGGGYLVRLTTKQIDNPATNGSDAYTISSEKDLALIAEHPDATFTVTKNITMTKSWTPVPIFTGTINGNGHTISGLTVDGSASKAFITDNQGTLRQLDFANATSVVTGTYTQTTRVAVVAVTNDGTIDQVAVDHADVEGGWRSAPIAAENTGTITNSYTDDAKVVANWESGGLVAWNSSTGLIEHAYVSDAKVTSATNNGGILTGYGYTGTKVASSVVISGTLTIPASTNQGRIVARENGTPTYSSNLAAATATINGQTVAGGTATNKNGQDTSDTALRTKSTYTGIGWDFTSIWSWDSALQRPVLTAVLHPTSGSGGAGAGGTGSTGGHGSHGGGSGTGSAHTSAATLTVYGGSTVRAGSIARLAGAHFAAGTRFTVELHSTPVMLGSATSNRSGAFTTSVRIPADTSLGTHHLHVLAANGADALRTPLAIRVVSSAGVSETGSLAYTGSQIGMAVVVLAGLGIIVGGALSGRRRAARRSHRGS